MKVVGITRLRVGYSLKRELVVAKKLVVDDFWLIVNGDWASCE